MGSDSDDSIDALFQFELAKYKDNRLLEDLGSKVEMCVGVCGGGCRAWTNDTCTWPPFRRSLSTTGGLKAAQGLRGEKKEMWVGLLSVLVLRIAPQVLKMRLAVGHQERAFNKKVASSTFLLSALTSNIKPSDSRTWKGICWGPADHLRRAASVLAAEALALLTKEPACSPAGWKVIWDAAVACANQQHPGAASLALALAEVAPDQVLGCWELMQGGIFKAVRAGNIKGAELLTRWLDQQHSREEYGSAAAAMAAGMAKARVYPEDRRVFAKLLTVAAGNAACRAALMGIDSIRDNLSYFVAATAREDGEVGLLRVLLFHADSRSCVLVRTAWEPLGNAVVMEKRCLPVLLDLLSSGADRGEVLSCAAALLPALARCMYDIRLVRQWPPVVEALSADQQGRLLLLSNGEFRAALAAGVDLACAPFRAAFDKLLVEGQAVLPLVLLPPCQPALLAGVAEGSAVYVGIMRALASDVGAWGQLCVKNQVGLVFALAKGSRKGAAGCMQVLLMISEGRQYLSGDQELLQAVRSRVEGTAAWGEACTGAEAFLLSHKPLLAAALQAAAMSGKEGAWLGVVQQLAADGRGAVREVLLSSNSALLKTCLRQLSAEASGQQQEAFGDLVRCLDAEADSEVLVEMMRVADEQLAEGAWRALEILGADTRANFLRAIAKGVKRSQDFLTAALVAEKRAEKRARLTDGVSLQQE